MQTSTQEREHESGSRIVTKVAGVVVKDNETKEFKMVLECIPQLDTKTLIHLASPLIPEKATIYTPELPLDIVEAAHIELYKRGYSVRGLRWFKRSDDCGVSDE